ncbi:hypothetical protein BC629DRAFT_763524 [Irpex lacteus]|nr:hypothetical protein BC629DRAFT_763524 [Irpex lacteus]
MSNRTPYSEYPLPVQFLRRYVKNSRSESAYARHDVSMNWPSFSGAAHGGEAYPKMPTKHLHRGVVVGDVMLEDTEAEKPGILVHWDHASKMKQEEKYEYHSFRTGTWSFMSIALLKDPSKVHEILDDLEALFWTLLYRALHRFEYTGAFSISIFNYRRFELLNGVPTGRIVGGSEKGGALSDIPIIIDFTCQPLQNMITALSVALTDYYHYFWNAMRSKKVADTVKIPRTPLQRSATMLRARNLMSTIQFSANHLTGSNCSRKN